MCTQLDHSAIFDLGISQYGDNATTNVVALGFLVGLLDALLVHDLAVLANAGILVNNGVADFGVVTNPNRQATLVQQGLPLLVRLVVVSTHDHGILHRQYSHNQRNVPEDVDRLLHTTCWRPDKRIRSLLPDAAGRNISGMMLLAIHAAHILALHIHWCASDMCA